MLHSKVKRDILVKMIEKSTTKEGEDHSKKPKHILVVEDDRALHKAIIFKLKRLGHFPISAYSAEEATEILKKSSEEIDFIWLDILLPGMDGLEFLRLMRKNPALKDKKVTVISVSGGLMMKDRAMELGADDYIVKSDHNLSDIVNMVVEKS